MNHPIFSAPDLTTFTGLGILGLTAINRPLNATKMGSSARPETVNHGAETTHPRIRCEIRRPEGSVSQRLVGGRTSSSSGSAATAVMPDSTCGVRTCPRRWRFVRSHPRRPALWALVGTVCTHLSVARIADSLGVSRNTAHDAVLAEGQRLLINVPTKFNGVAVLGIDEQA